MMDVKQKINECVMHISNAIDVLYEILSTPKFNQNELLGATMIDLSFIQTRLIRILEGEKK